MGRRGAVTVLVGDVLLGVGVALAPAGPWRWTAHTLGMAAAAVVVALAVRRQRPSPVLPWHLMAAGLAVLAVAGVAAGLQADAAGPVALPLVAGLELLGTAGISGGVIALVEARVPRGLPGLLDTAIGAVLTTAVLWIAVAMPRLAAEDAGATTTVVMALLVVVHALTLTAGVRLVVVAGAWHLASYWLLLGSGACAAAATLPFMLVGLRWVQPLWVPLAWLGAAVLLAAAAADPSMRDLTARAPARAEATARPWRWAFLSLAAISVPLTSLVTRLFDDQTLNELSSAMTLALIVLVVLRTYGIVQARDRAAAEAAELADFNAAVLASLQSLTAVLDRDGVVVDANEHWRRMAAAPARARLWCDKGESYVATLRLAAARGVPDAGPAATAVEDVLAGRRDGAELELAAYLTDERRWFIMRVSPLAGAGHGVVVSHDDVTWRLEAEEAVRARADQQATVSWLSQHALSDVALPELLDEAVTMIAVTLSIESATVYERLPDDSLVLRAAIGWSDEQVGVMTVPSGSSSLVGYAAESDTPVVVSDLASDDRFPAAGELLQRGLHHGVAVTIPGRERPWGVLAAYSGGGREFTTDDVHFFQSVANVLSAAIERRRSEQEALHAAFHDPLTGLPNRALLRDRLHQAMARRSGRGQVALLHCDVDDFKSVNLALGHVAGDELLRALASRLQACLRPGDTLARLASDELVVLCEDVAGEAEAEEIAQRLHAALEAPFLLRATERRITMSIGIAVAGPDDDAESLARSADTAMRRAKGGGRGRQSVFDEELRRRSDRRRDVAEGLRGAAERGELSVVYQPVVSLAAGEIVAAEALLRWHHPELGHIAPGLFIPIAEETGTIEEIGAWVLQRTCEQIARWGDLLPADRPFTVYVNLSARQLAASDFVRQVAAVLDSSATAPERLGLEITESLLVSDPESAARTLERLKAMGLTLAMDDFGTGYSSLSYLKRLPVDVVKVDRSFVDGLGRDAGDAAIVAAVVRMAAALRLRVTAEGVETALQLSELRALGCDQAQGYYFARPMAPDDLATLLAEPPRNGALR